MREVRRRDRLHAHVGSRRDRGSHARWRSAGSGQCAACAQLVQQVSGREHGEPCSRPTRVGRWAEWVQVDGDEATGQVKGLVRGWAGSYSDSRTDPHESGRPPGVVADAGAVRPPATTRDVRWPSMPPRSAPAAPAADIRQPRSVGRAPPLGARGLRSPARGVAPRSGRPARSGASAAWRVVPLPASRPASTAAQTSR